VVACRNTPQETLIDHEENGMLVGYGHAEELAGTLCRLLSDDDLRARLGRHGKERMTAAFTWDTTAPRFRDEYYRIVNEQRSAP
jgi:glycosyltransferase involved in cell wall biosynthesis